MTKDFLLAVKDKRTWCLHTSEITTARVCADPPKKFEFAQMLGNLMMGYRAMGEPTDTNLRKTALLIKQKPPSVDWMV